MCLYLFNRDTNAVSHVTYLVSDDQALEHELKMFEAIQPSVERRKKQLMGFYVFLIAALPILGMLYFLGYIGLPYVQTEQIISVFFMFFPMAARSANSAEDL